MSVTNRGIYVRPLGLSDMTPTDHKLGRTVHLVVPGSLFRLTPDEADDLAEHLRWVARQSREQEAATLAEEAHEEDHARRVAMAIESEQQPRVADPDAPF